MPDILKLNLPKLNGTIDVGISVGTDLGLKEADRLQVHTGAGLDDETAKMLTLRQVYNHCSATRKFDPTICDLAVSMAGNPSMAGNHCILCNFVIHY